jgi:hypothetical protein
MTVVEIANEVGLSVGSVHTILSQDLGMRCVCAKFVTRLLSDDQMDCRKTIAGDLFEKSKQDLSFLSKVVTGDETWEFAYDPKSKVESSEWHTKMSPRPKKSRATKSNVKVMLIVFFDNECIVHHEFVPRGRSITAAYYTEVLTPLHENVRRRWPQK